MYAIKNTLTLLENVKQNSNKISSAFKTETCKMTTGTKQHCTHNKLISKQNKINSKSNNLHETGDENTNIFTISYRLTVLSVFGCCDYKLLL